MRITSFIFCILWFGFASAQQPPICGNNPAMTSFCSEACIICDIDGFTGRNNSNIQGQAPPGFCTTEVHHMQWIGFIAGTTNLTLEVRVSNCSRNQGLEIGLYEGIGCQNFRKISDCDTDVRPGEIRVFSNTVPLVIGQYYYFVMDGSANDICDWTIKVTAGSTKVAPLEIAPEIFIPNEVCQDFNIEITTPGVIGATFYNWSVDGVQKNIGTTFTNTFEKPGIYKVCLDASNVCDQAPQTCRNVTVLPTPRTNVSQEVCYGECFTFLGNKYCESGTYEVKLSAANGCDSIISLDLSIKDKVTAFSKIQICEGDTILIGDGMLYASGMHEVNIQNQEGCNIFMTVDVVVIICNIQSNTDVTPVLCNGENTGALKFKIDAGTPPFVFKCFKVENTSVKFEGSIANVNEWVTINNLDEGNYTIVIDDTYGNNNVIHQFVSQPSKLEVLSTSSDYNTFGVSCFGSDDGYIKINPSGGSPPYNFAHDFSDQNVDSIGSLVAGNYHTLINDVNGCIIESDVEISSPEPLSINRMYQDPNCSGPTSGTYTILSVMGGTQPFSHTLNDVNVVTGQMQSSLIEGIYSLVTTDANGCELIVQDTLVAAVIPEVLVDSEILTVSLGDSIRLNANSNILIPDVTWIPSFGISCVSCLTTSALPIEDTEYTISIVSTDGCESRANIEVKVIKNRSFVMSNIFTPDGNGVNDKITYLAGKDVSQLEYLRIYDRWGNLVFLIENVPATGVSVLDWNAEFHGQYLQNGVFTWVANVLYIDQIAINYAGSLTVLR